MDKIEVPADFNWRLYLELNPDVANVPQYNNEEGAQTHWKYWGVHEKRKYKKPGESSYVQILDDSKNKIPEKKLTIIVPNKTGNSPDITIKSLYKQTFTNFDIVIINDLSGNANKARNDGLRYVKTPYVLFSDNDINWLPDSIQNLYDCLEKNPNVSIAYGSCNIDIFVAGEQEWDEALLTKRNYISMMSMVRTKDHPGFDENIKRMQDWDTWLTMLEKGKKGKYIGKKIFTTTSSKDGITKNSIDYDEAVQIVKRKHSLHKFDIKTTTTLNEYFDNIYCLNLDRRSDKWTKVQKRFKKLNILVERFSGTDGDNLSEDIIKKYPKLNKYEIGCMLSYYRIIEDAKRKKYERILVLEDDVIFLKDFTSKFNDNVKKISDWKLIHIGAAQHNWMDVIIPKDLPYYYSNRTEGTFAIGFHESIYNEILNGRDIINPIDTKMFDIQKKYKKQCLTFFPNLIISDISDSDIRPSRDMSFHSDKMKWNTNLYDFSNEIKILLLPDVKGWAFDKITDSIIKYNPYTFITYEKHYTHTEHDFVKSLNYNDWDYVFLLFEGNKILTPNNKKLIRGCYSALWLESDTLTEKELGNNIKNSRAIVYVNDKIKSLLSPYCEPTESVVINDASDIHDFYPTNIEKFKEFTVLFAGNTTRKIKRFEKIKEMCKKAGVRLEIAQNLNQTELLNLYNKCHLSINYSVSEGGPQTLFESSLCETPMILNGEISMSEKVPCFRSFSEKDMVDQLVYLKKNPNKCTEMGKKARQFVLENNTYEITGKKFNDFFLNLAISDELIGSNEIAGTKSTYNPEITIFVISSGENPNYVDCISSISKQTMKGKFDVIKNYAPMSRAFQEMIDRCDTKYYIQVDEDMILLPTAVETMYNSIKNTNKNISMVAHMLHDTHIDINIYGIKIYKHDIFKNYPYNLEIISCEKEQTDRLAKDGYIVDTPAIVIGEHSPKWTDELIFERYFDLMEKYKVYKYDWIKNLPEKLELIYKSNPSDLNYYALMGAKASINSTGIRNREKNYLIKDERFTEAQNKRIKK